MLSCGIPSPHLAFCRYHYLRLWFSQHAHGWESLVELVEWTYVQAYSSPRFWFRECEQAPEVCVFSHLPGESDVDGAWRLGATLLQVECLRTHLLLPPMDDTTWLIPAKLGLVPLQRLIWYTKHRTFSNSDIAKHSMSFSTCTPYQTFPQSAISLPTAMSIHSHYWTELSECWRLVWLSLNSFQN